MGTKSSAKRGITPPKGRPTRARDEVAVERRVFGPVAQWIAFTLIIALVFLVLFFLTDGGNFNRFNGGSSGAVVDLVGLGVLTI